MALTSASIDPEFTCRVIPVDLLLFTGRLRKKKGNMKVQEK